MVLSRSTVPEPPIAPRDGVNGCGHQPSGRRLLIAISALGVACLTWSRTTPRPDLLAWLLGAGLAATGTLGWALLVAYAVANRRWRTRLLIGPAVAVLLAVAFALNAPLWTRWELSRDAFDQVAARTKPVKAQCGELTSADWTLRPDLSGEFGSYRIVEVDQVPCGLILFDETSCLTHSAGFAYLPGGPEQWLSDGSFSNPAFRPLGGGWFVWTAS